MCGNSQDFLLPTPKSILNLGHEIASLENLNTQIDHVNAHINNIFGLEPRFWFKFSHKLTINNFLDADFPGNPETLTSKFQEEHIDFHQWHQNDLFLYAFPLKHGDQIFGLYLIKQNAPLDTKFLESLIETIHIASLEFHATIQEELHQWRLKKLALVQSVSSQISQINNMEELTPQITQLVQESFGYYYVAVFLINQNTQTLHFKASAGAEETSHPEFEQPNHPGFKLGEHMIGHVAKTGQEIIANDVTKEKRYKTVNALKATQSEAVLPLRIENRILGVFDIQSNRQNAFDENDLIVLRTLADNIAIAIESTRLYLNEQRRAEQMKIVSEVSRSITSILDIDILLTKIVNLIHDQFDFPYVHLYFVEAFKNKIVFKAGSGERTPLYSKANISFDLDSTQGILPWVVKNGLTKRVNNVDQEPLFLNSPYAQERSGSEMAVPLKFGVEILGVLDIQSHDKNAFSSEDQELMETLADNLAIAIRNANLYHSEKWRRQVAESLRDVAGLLSENTALDDILNTILSQLHKNLPCDVAAVWLFEEEPSDLTFNEGLPLYLAAVITTKDISSDGLIQMKATPDAWIQQALDKRQTVIRKPNQAIGPIATHLNMPKNYSGIAAPLFTGDEVLGILTLIHRTNHKYGEESKKITSSFASYAAIAIKNTRLYARSQEQAWISTILLQIAQATQSVTELDELATKIVRLTPMVVGVKGCGLILRDPESEIFSIHALYGIGGLNESLMIDKPIPLIDAPILQNITPDIESVPVNHPITDLNLTDDQAEQFTNEPLIMLPLVIRNEILGAFLLSEDKVINSHEFHNDPAGSERYRIIQGIMQQTAVAIENIRLIEARQEEAYVSTVLLQTAQAVVTSTNIDDTLESLVQIMLLLVGIESSVIYLWDKADSIFTTAHFVTNSTIETIEMVNMGFALGEFPMLDTIFRNNHPIVYPFTETLLPPDDWDLVIPDDGQLDPEPILKSRYPLLMGFPLAVKDEFYGALLAQDKSFTSNRERKFDLLWGIAQQASLAIQYDRLNLEMIDRERIEREFQLAREIQQTFLPNQLPDLAGWGIDVRWETARQVGGDFYDCFILPDNKLGFLIADVSDKGLAASLYMAVTRTLIRAVAIDNQHPADTLEHVNDLLLMNSESGLFVTIFYGALDLASGDLDYTIAGHNPPMLLQSASNNVHKFDIGGIAIGAMPDIQLPKRHSKIEPGDCLVLYTDGVTEAMTADQKMYGDHRLENKLSEVLGLNAHKVLEYLEQDIKQFREGTPLSDDTTMLAICREHLLANENRDTGSP